MSSNRINFRTSRDWFALDWDEAQEFKRRLREAAPGSGAADEIERSGSHTSVNFTHHQKEVAVEVINASLDGEGATTSSELLELRDDLERDLSSISGHSWSTTERA